MLRRAMLSCWCFQAPCCRSLSSSSAALRVPPLYSEAKLSRFGWEWVDSKSSDENWLDLAYMLSRNSVAIDGHMGCCIVKGKDVLVESRNHGLYEEFRSDVHAEASAICAAAKDGVSLRNSTLYVTRAPCARCYKLIAETGIEKVVAPTAMETKEREHAANRGLTYLVIKDNADRKQWRDAIAEPFRDQNNIDTLRMQRKIQKENFKRGKRNKRDARMMTPLNNETT